MSELSIKVLIADRPYHLTIDRKDEEIIRKAAKTINNLLKKYSDNYAFKDKQDLLAMVALNFTTSALSYEEEVGNYTEDILEKLKQIDKLLKDQED